MIHSDAVDTSSSVLTLSVAATTKPSQDQAAPPPAIVPLPSGTVTSAPTVTAAASNETSPLDTSPLSTKMEKSSIVFETEPSRNSPHLFSSPLDVHATCFPVSGLSGGYAVSPSKRPLAFRIFSPSLPHPLLHPVVVPAVLPVAPQSVDPKRCSEGRRQNKSSSDLFHLASSTLSKRAPVYDDDPVGRPLLVDSIDRQGYQWSCNNAEHSFMQRRCCGLHSTPKVDPLACGLQFSTVVVGYRPRFTVADIPLVDRSYLDEFVLSPLLLHSLQE